MGYFFAGLDGLFEQLAKQTALEGDCLVYKGQPNTEYPQISVFGVQIGVHVAVYRYISNERVVWPEIICHTCDIKACWNPNHLYKGTYSDNMKDVWERVRSRKHPFEDDVVQLVIAGFTIREITRKIPYCSDSFVRKISKRVLAGV